MKNKGLIVAAFLSLAVGLALWGANMLTHTTREKPLQATAPSQPRIEQPAAPEPLKKTSGPRELEKDNNTSPKAAPEAAAIKVPEKGLDELAAINEQTIVGTEWGDAKFKLEFGPQGKLIIGGNVRANWRIEGDRIKLYSNDGREVHWLDIEGNRLTWNGEPVGRFK